jgi:carbon monoxide dehydrogenase subunit G
MKIEKTFTVDAPQQRVWEFITSPALIAPCIPGCEGAEETEPGKYKARINTKVGPIKTTFTVEIERTEERPPEFAAYDTRGDEGSRASRIKASTSLTLSSPRAEQTEVSYHSDIHIMGRLGKFGTGMMQKIADGIGDEFVAALKERMEGKKPEAAAELPAKAAPPGKALLWWAIGIGIGLAALLLVKFLL